MGQANDHWPGPLPDYCFGKYRVMTDTMNSWYLSKDAELFVYNSRRRLPVEITLMSERSVVVIMCCHVPLYNSFYCSTFY